MSNASQTMPSPALSKKVKIQRAVMAAGALIYASVSHHFHVIFLPTKHSKPLILHGVAADFLELALIVAACANILPLLAKATSAESFWQYERRRRYCACGGHALFGLGLLWGAFGLAERSFNMSFNSIWPWLSWLACGTLFGWTGFLPPSYLRREKKNDAVVYEEPRQPLGMKWIYLGSLQLMLLAATWFWLLLLLIRTKTDALFAMNGAVSFIFAALLALAGGSAYGGWFIIQRTNSKLEPAEASLTISQPSNNLLRTREGWFGTLLLIMVAIALTFGV